MRLIRLSVSVFLFCGLIILGSSRVFAEEHPQFDIAKINVAIATGLAEFGKKSTEVDSLEYSFDPEQTDINNDQYVLNLSFSMPKTAWSNEGLEVAGTLGFSTDLADASMKGFTVSFDVNYRTDALAAIKYKVSRMTQCSQSYKSEGIMGVLLDRHLEYANRINEVDSIEGLYELMQEKISDHKSDIESYSMALERVTSSKTLQESADVAQVASLLNREILKTQKILDYIVGIQIERTEDGFILRTPANTECPIMGTTGLQVGVTGSSIRLVGDFELKMGKSIYRAKKPILLEVLRGLENGESFASKFVELDAAAFVEMVSNLMGEAEVPQG